MEATISSRAPRGAANCASRKRTVMGPMAGETYIVDAVRTPTGRYGGALAGVRPDDLAARRARGSRA